MKILHICQRYHPAFGGSEQYMQIISEHLAQKHHVDVWTTDAIDSEALWDIERKRTKEESTILNGVKITRFPVAPTYLSQTHINKAYRKFSKFLPSADLRILGTTPTAHDMLRRAQKDTHLDYDIVHVTAAPYFILFKIASTVAERLSIPLVITPFLHTGTSKGDTVYKTYFNLDSLPYYQAADTILIQTDAEKETLQSFAGEYGLEIPTRSFIKLGMAIDPDEISGGDAKRFREKYKVNEPIVFYVGAKVGNKGTLNLIRAMEILWKKGVAAKLALAGNASKEFNKFWAKLPETTKKNILNLSYITDKDKNDLFAAGDIFSMVSKSDSFGIVYLEAWYHGKPVLGCNTPAIRDVISGREDGYLVEFHDIGAIASKIEYLLAHPEKRAALGKAGRKKVLAQFTWDRKLEIIDGVYHNLTKR